MSIDLDRITHPLRLASGSHQRGSGKGCAMNVISYINGDTEITDYPRCSARPLARLVQALNDRLAGPDGFLSPENSLIVLDLGWQTVGTSGSPPEVVWRWLSELLVAPEHGVVRYASHGGAAAIRRVAGLCVRQADGEYVSAEEWTIAANATDSAADAADSAATYYAADAAYSAAYSATYSAADAADAADSAATYYAVAAAVIAACYAACYAANATYSGVDADDADAGTYALIEFTTWAIQRWRHLAGLDNTPADETSINTALAQLTK
jgi:hypothetical protein